MTPNELERRWRVNVHTRSGLDHLGDGHRDDQLRAPLGGVPELRGDLRSEIPREDHDRVGPGLRDPLRWMDRDMRAGSEAPVLVRVAVDRVIEEVRADPTVVEQRVPLPGRT